MLKRDGLPKTVTEGEAQEHFGRGRRDTNKRIRKDLKKLCRKLIRGSNVFNLFVLNDLADSTTSVVVINCRFHEFERDGVARFTISAIFPLISRNRRPCELGAANGIVRRVTRRKTPAKSLNFQRPNANTYDRRRRRRYSIRTVNGQRNDRAALGRLEGGRAGARGQGTRNAEVGSRGGAACLHGNSINSPSEIN